MSRVSKDLSNFERPCENDRLFLEMARFTAFFTGLLITLLDLREMPWMGLDMVVVAR